jgi:hypothetical protein
LESAFDFFKETDSTAKFFIETKDDNNGQNEEASADSEKIMSIQRDAENWDY